MRFNEDILEVIREIKQCMEYYDAYNADDLQNISLSETSMCEFYEELSMSKYLVSVEYNEETTCAKYFFSSDEMTEYYRLSYRIGKKSGQSKGNNVYISKALQKTLAYLNSVETNGACCGIVHSGTRHRYASSVTIYICEEEFYEYMKLYFAVNAIFRYYKEEVKKLRKIYISMLDTEDLEAM